MNDVTGDRRFGLTPQTIWEVLDGEVVIANFDGGSYYTLGGSGVAIWTGLVAGRSLEPLATELATAVGEDAELVVKHARELADRLVAENLLVESGADAPSPPTGGDSPADVDPVWAEPTLEKFSDMQQLLMLDPIHEVDDSGWPSQVDPS